MGSCTKGNGTRSLENEMVLEFSSGLMGVSTKACGEGTRRMAEEG